MAAAVRTAIAVCGPLIALLWGCGGADLGVTQIGVDARAGSVSLAPRFTRGETLACAYDPPQPSPAFTQPLGPEAKDAESDLREVCPRIRARDIPFKLLVTEETVVFGLRDCRITAVYKSHDPEGRYYQAAPQGLCARPDRLRAVHHRDGWPELRSG
jgi:hypothetical protein